MIVKSAFAASHNIPRLRVIGLALGLTSAVLAASPAVALAASPRQAQQIVLVNKNFSVTYSRSWTFKTSHLHRCVVLTASGTFAYHLKGTEFRSKDYEWSHQRLSDPTITASVQNYSKGKCSGRANVSKISLAQYWTGYGCSYNPSIGFSVPWGISFSLWPNCGDRNQVGYKTHYGRGSRFRQFNSGSPASFGNFSENVGRHSKPIPPCYGVYPATTIYVGNSSDSYGAGNLHSAGRVCLYKT